MASTLDVESHLLLTTDKEMRLSLSVFADEDSLMSNSNVRVNTAHVSSLLTNHIAEQIDGTAGTPHRYKSNAHY